MRPSRHTRLPGPTAGLSAPPREPNESAIRAFPVLTIAAAVVTCTTTEAGALRTAGGGARSSRSLTLPAPEWIGIPP